MSTLSAPRVWMPSIAPLPEDVLLEILSLVHPLDLIHRCRLVCGQWRDVVDSSTLWKKICQRLGLLPADWNRPPRDWQKYYYLRSRRRNLLKNACANEGFKSWKLEKNFGDSWKVEDLPGEQGQPFPDDTITKYFVTSYRMCFKSQLIDLWKMGYNKTLLDEEQPDIAIIDWFAARADYGCKYKLEVQLLAERKKVVCNYSPRLVFIPQWSNALWQKKTHTLRTTDRECATYTSDTGERRWLDGGLVRGPHHQQQRHRRTARSDR